MSNQDLRTRMQCKAPVKHGPKPYIQYGKGACLPAGRYWNWQHRNAPGTTAVLLPPAEGRPASDA